jgi:hypothetical protein
MVSTMKRQHVVVVAVATVIALALAFAVGLLIGSSDGDDTASPSPATTARDIDGPVEPTEPPAADTEAPEAPEPPAAEPPATDAPDTEAPATEAPATEGEDLSVEPDDAETLSEGEGGPLAGNFGEAAEVVPPGEPFVAEFATAADFYDRFDWDWGMRPDPRTFDIAPEGLTAQADHSGHGNADLACGPPTETRTIHLREPVEQVYWCGPKGPESGHIMTATPFTGYGILTFSPRQSFTDITKV